MCSIIGSPASDSHPPSSVVRSNRDAGVGPRATLESLGIPLVSASEGVGANLIDRKEVSVGIPVLGSASIEGESDTILDAALYLRDFWGSVVHKRALPWTLPFVQPIFAPEHRTDGCRRALLGALLAYGSGALPELLSSIAGVYVAQRRPRARGRVTISSADPDASAHVFDGWTQGSADAAFDLEVLANATAEVIIPLFRTSLPQALGHPPLEPGGTFAPSLVSWLASAISSNVDLLDQLPECGPVTPSFLSTCTDPTACVPSFPPLPLDRSQLAAAIRPLVSSSQHCLGTAAVGSVVEAGSLRVTGVEGLRVADLAVFSAPIDTHPMLSAMAAGHLLGSRMAPVASAQHEAAPIVFAFVWTAATIVFTLWLLVHLCGHAGSSRSDDKPPELASVHRLNSWTGEHLRQQLSRKPTAEVFQPLADAAGGEAVELEAVAAAAPAQEGATSVEAEHERQGADPPVPPLLRWDDLSCGYQRKGGSANSGACVEPVIQAVSGQLLPHELVAVMGCVAAQPNRTLAESRR